MAHKLEVPDVIASALNETGLDHSSEEVSDWLEGNTSDMPPDVGPVLDSILKNLPYHVRVIQARMLAQPDITRSSLTKIASIPRTERKSKVSRRHEGRSGEQCFHGAQRMYLSQRALKALKAISHAMGISQGALVELWLENAIQNVIRETEHITGIPAPTKQKLANSKLPEPAIRSTIKKMLAIERRSPLD